MDAYLRLVHDLTKDFEFFELTKVPRGENICTDALAALGSKLHDQVKWTIPIHRIGKPSIDSTDEKAPVVLSITDAVREDDASANQPKNDQLQTGAPNLSTSSLTAYCPLPAKKREARRLKQRSAHYVVMNGELHRWTATKVLHKCIHGEKTGLIMLETHEGAAGNHSRGRALALKVKSLDFYCPTMNTDCESYV